MVSVSGTVMATEECLDACCGRAADPAPCSGLRLGFLQDAVDGNETVNCVSASVC